MPKKVLSLDTTIVQLAEENRRLNRRHMFIGCEDRIEILETVNSRILGIGDKRSVSNFKQIYLLLRRHLTNVTRDPIAIFAVTIMAVFQALT